jgi:hypothetical protein
MTLTQFAASYRAKNCPHDPKLMNRVLVTDVSTSILVWSEEEFLVEMYLMHPNTHVKPHSHPFENIILFMGGRLSGKREGSEQYNIVDIPTAIGRPLAPNMQHEFTVGSSGAVFYNISKWEASEQKDSAILKYQGTPLGPLHENLLQKYG